MIELHMRRIMKEKSKMTLKTGLGSLICINEPKLKETGTKIKTRLQNQIFSIFFVGQAKKRDDDGKKENTRL